MPPETSPTPIPEGGGVVHPDSFGSRRRWKYLHFRPPCLCRPGSPDPFGCICILAHRREPPERDGARDRHPHPRHHPVCALRRWPFARLKSLSIMLPESLLKIYSSTIPPLWDLDFIFWNNSLLPITRKHSHARK